MATAATVAPEDIVVANLVDYWKEDSSSKSVIDFLRL
jgi:hypothetical protein